jgi:O-antigen ligase
VLYGVPVIVLLTLTRGLWLGFFLGLWVSTFLGYRLLHVSQRLRLISLVFLLVPIVLLSVLALTPSQVVEERLGDEGTIQERLTTWRIVLHAGLEQPLFGIGLNDLRYVLGRAVLQYWREDFRFLRTTHNSYISILVELGVVGFLVYCMLIVSLIHRGVKLYRMGLTIQERWRGVAILGILTAHFTPFFFSNILYNWTVSHVYVFVCLGAIVGLCPARSPRHERSGPVQPHLQVALAPLRGE